MGARQQQPSHCAKKWVLFQRPAVPALLASQHILPGLAAESIISLSLHKCPLPMHGSPTGIAAAKARYGGGSGYLEAHGRYDDTSTQ
jgi:hypothetical protein